MMMMIDVENDVDKEEDDDGDDEMTDDDDDDITSTLNSMGNI